MIREIHVFGTNRDSNFRPEVEVRDLTEWLMNNIQLQKHLFEQWELNNIDDNMFSIAMNEGFDKLEAFTEEIQRSIDKVIKNTNPIPMTISEIIETAEQIIKEN